MYINLKVVFSVLHVFIYELFAFFFLFSFFFFLERSETNLSKYDTVYVQFENRLVEKMEMSVYLFLANHDLIKFLPRKQFCDLHEFF